MSFTGKVVIITGASAGIGASAAVEFAKEGATIVIQGRDEARLEKTAQAVRSEAGLPETKILKVLGSMEDDDTPKRIVDTAVETFNKIDVLVNNAGSSGLLAKFDGCNSMEVCDYLFRVNFRPAAMLTQLAMPHLIATRGNVVNVSSITAQMVLFPQDAYYACMKAALDTHTRTMANLYGAKGVRVNAVAPGPIETMVLAKERSTLVEPTFLSVWAKSHTVLGRVGQPVEVATVMRFLASDAASYVTGAVWVVDGGALVSNP